MGRKSFKPGTLIAPLPAVMVSLGEREEKNIITIAWTGILSSDPARTYISVRPTRHSHALLMKSGEFVINLVSEELALACDYSGIYTGAKVDKFEKCGLHAVPSETVKAPTIEEAPLSLECRVFDVIKSGTHDIFMADIVNVSCREDILDERGKICYDRARLIAYSHGEYFSLGKIIGKFGYSTDKKNRGKIADRKPCFNDLKKANGPKKLNTGARTSKKTPYKKKDGGKR